MTADDPASTEAALASTVEASTRARIAGQLSAQYERVSKMRPRVCEDEGEGHCHRDAWLSALDFAIRTARGDL